MYLHNIAKHSLKCHAWMNQPHVYIYIWKKRNPMVECINLYNESNIIPALSSFFGLPFWWWNSGLKKSKNVSLQDSDSPRLFCLCKVPYEWCDTNLGTSIQWNWWLIICLASRFPGNVAVWKLMKNPAASNAYPTCIQYWMFMNCHLHSHFPYKLVYAFFWNYVHKLHQKFNGTLRTDP